MSYKKLMVLTHTNAVATQEYLVHRYIKEVITPYVDEVFTDNFGNLICRKKGDGPKLLLSAHVDQIGFLIHEIDANGCLKFTPVGGLIPFTLISQKVIINETIGIIGLNSGADMSNLNTDQMFIDIGAKHKEDAEKKVSVGDFGNFYSEYYETDDIIISPALDDRIGCYILMEVIEKIKDSKYDLYFVFSSQEEIGTRGAFSAAYTIEPEYGISVDITPAGDIPSIKNSTSKMGEGVGIKLMDPGLIIHPELKVMLEETAKTFDIPYQFEVMKRGGTDAGAFQSVKTGIKSAALSIPTRHAHSSNEMCSKKDVHAAIELLTKLVEK
ncbi:MAG: M20/M25/M40 family metallo-hydrolase [Clostridia bacterium]|nr:M20/M25/M40 family metallo-hydrolase [Clostridia bacterium]